MEKALFVLSGVLGFLAVALGAFGAHGLEPRLEGLVDGASRLSYFRTAAHYHLAHALSLGLAAHLSGRRGPGATPAAVSGLCFAAGVLVFSGSLYAMSLTGVRALGALTPVGGLLLLVGWAALAVSAWRLS